ncbi:MAG TPA: hypothetical protein VK985_05235 [Rariglobus sp.]|nr:hypothetical protein [Rariglobus sp.]
MHFSHRSISLRFTAVALGGIAFFCVPSASAQTVEFRVLSWDGPIENLSYDSEGKSIPLSAAENGLSLPYRFQGGAALELYREEKIDEKIVRVPVARLPLPANLTKAILVLARSGDDKHSYAGMWMDDSFDARPVNCLKFFNLSHVPVALKIGTEDIQLAPQESSKLLPFDLKTRSLPLKVAVNSGAGWEVVSSERQTVREGLRILVLFHDGHTDSEGNRTLIDFVKLYDYVQPQPRR